VLFTCDACCKNSDFSAGCPLEHDPQKRIENDRQLSEMAGQAAIVRLVLKRLRHDRRPVEKLSHFEKRQK
jgi:hypothetical protein